LGNGGTSNSNTPVAVSMSGVLSGKSIKQVSVGRGSTTAAGTHVCAVTTDGGAYCWGLNSSGELGNGSTTDATSPVAVSTSGVLSGKLLSQISASTNHTCALTADGLVFCWGANGSGQLGDGTTTARTSPVAVDTSGVLSGKTIVQIATGDGDTCAVDSNGVAYCWGVNAQGQLGQPSAGGRSSVPVAVDTSGVLSGKIVNSITVG